MKMTGVAVLISLLCLTATDALAWRPSGWVYADYPFVYSNHEQHWFFMSEQGPYGGSYVYDMVARQWTDFASSSLRAAPGWVYVQWPYAYSNAQARWYYLDPYSSQLVCDLTSGGWSVFGNEATSTMPTADYSLYLPDDFTISYIRSEYGEVSKILGSIYYSSSANRDDTFSFDWQHIQMNACGFTAYRTMEYGVITHEWHEYYMTGRVTASGAMVGKVVSNWVVTPIDGPSRSGGRETDYIAAPN